MTETNTALDERRSASVQPGDLAAQLVACREKAGLNMEQAAKEMHLSLNLLRALEKADFAHLPEPPYVRGYLRSYAKLGNKDPKELIRLYDQLRGADPDANEQHFAPAKPLNKVTQPALSSSTVKFILFGSVILLLGLISMIPGVREWATNQWHEFSAQTNAPEVPRPAAALSSFAAQKEAEEKAAQEAIARKQAEEKAAQEEQARKEAEAKTAAAQVAETSKPTTAVAPTANATVATNVTATTATSNPATTDTQNSMAGNPTAAPATSDGATLAAASTDPATATTATGTSASINGEVNIKMEFSEEVWVQIKDDGKKTVFESLNSPGTTKEFKATTPLNFKIGNANGVKMYLNGQPYDQTPYIKGSVARFKVE